MDNQIAKYEIEGRDIYNNNKHYQKIANLMEHPEFRDFYNKYLKDWDTAKTIIMFMQIYEGVEKHSTTELSPYQKICIVKSIIDDSETRKKICSYMFNELSLDERHRNYNEQHNHSIREKEHSLLKDEI